MRILIKPSDIVKRCLWDSYTYYVVRSEKEAEKLLKEDKEFEYYELGCVKNSEPSKCKNFVPDIKEKRK